MSTLKYLPRVTFNLKDAPKVYFCAHPQELDTFLNPIYEDISDITRCSLWYLENPNEARDEEFWADLGQMQLVVMAVTSKLLNSENLALEEFRYAVAHHIPVLPLMQESGLEAKFNAICGNLQFLDKNDPDNTAIPFQDKLLKFLATVFTPDDMIDKIRAAFDAYVFLSYRKKDRHHAQELMRLIHRNEFARDIAIWYDEFLTPGENFNDAIRTALEKSDLFALAVTPNLVNEDNYIRQHEFPMAIKIKKPILPIEMLSTDRKALEAQYEGIPSCTDGHNEAALSKALLEALQQLALQQNDSDPIHNYLIGLAYLSGIDVEVDYPRALALITNAAENGLVEAAKNLVDMYEIGQGVERNVEKAFSWQVQVAKMLKNRYDADPTEDNLEDLFMETMVCATWWTDSWRQGDIQRSKPFFQAARDLVAPVAERSPRMQRLLSMAYCAQGEVFRFREPEALPLFQKGLEIYESYAKTVQSTQAREELAELYHDMGETYWANTDPDTAKKYYAQAVAMAYALAEELGTTKALENFFHIASSWQRLCRSFGTPQEIKTCCDRLLALADAQDSHSDDPDTGNLLSSIYESVGRDLIFLQDYKEARRLLEQALALTAWKETEPNYIQNRVQAYMEFGDAFLHAKQFDAAFYFYKKGVALAKKYPLNLKFAIWNSPDRNLLNAYRQAEAWDKAEALCLQRIEEHMANNPNNAWLSHLYGEYGYTLQCKGDISGAQKQYEKSYLAAESYTLEKGKALVDPDIFQFCHKAAETCLDTDSKKALYQRCLSVVEQLYDLDAPAPIAAPIPPQNMTQRPQIRTEILSPPYLQWSELHIRLGDLLEKDGASKAALENYIQALTVWEACSQRRKDRVYWERLSLICEKLAALYRQEENPAAESYQERLKAIKAELARLPKLAAPFVAKRP